jgi:hypothetical protein
MHEDVTHDAPHGWTIETALAHALAIIASNDRRYQQQFDALEKNTAMALSGAERAVSKAETASEKRFDGVNEFRNTLADQQRTLMPRSEVDGIKHALDDKVQALKERMDKSESERAGLKGGYAVAVAVVGLFALIASVVIAFMK